MRPRRRHELALADRPPPTLRLAEGKVLPLRTTQQQGGGETAYRKPMINKNDFAKKIPASFLLVSVLSSGPSDWWNTPGRDRWSHPGA